MEAAPEQAHDEIERLQSYINDLISVQALPAIWSGHDAHQIVNKLLEVLTRLLRLDFAVMRVNDPNGGPPIEAVRLPPDRNPDTHSHERRALEAWLKGDLPAGRVLISNPVGTGEVTIAPFRLGLQDEIGFVVAASVRTNFPTDMERLLLRVAVNQAVIGLQEARRSGEQNRVAEALDQLVAERTRQLTAANDELQRSEAFLAQGQAISHTGSFGWNPSSGEIYWSEETYNIFELDRSAKPTLEFLFERTHPDDREPVQQALDDAIHENSAFDIEHRLLMPDGSIKYLHVLARTVENSSGDMEHVGAVTDVTAAKLAEMKLRESEAYLAEAQKLSHTGSWAWNPTTSKFRYWSDECFRLMGFDPAGGMPPFETVAQRFHPDDQPIIAESLGRARRERSEHELDYRIIHPGGEIRNLHAVVHPVLGPSGDLVEFVGSVIDVTAVKQAGEALRRSESYLAEAQRLTHTGSGAWSVPGWDALYLSEEWYRIYGFDPKQGLSAWKDRLQRMHADDQAKVQEAKERAVREKSDYEVDHRIILPDGTVKYTHTIGHPVLNASGDVEQFVCTMMDVTERKKAEEALREAFEEIKGLRDRLYRENLALKAEVDQSSMFEEIVGTSSALRAVLSRVSKVAPTDSTVLITGETGTGKELIARAVHKRSQRSSRAFVSVNCAAIPRDLIASELFGHEKGAFTGALQRRLGRFELAEGGTIFLDEIGELTAETQIALLRVLQEHEFERVGGTGSIRTNVRVIAATNRDLQGAIDAGMFRSDLFYRLNVFPIEVPPLRERKEDIPVLVAYFIDRFARKSGKSIRSANKRSLELLQAYPWPGNIRELQNVIERSVIVCDTEIFSVDESWLSRQPLPNEPKSQPELTRELAAQEKEMIEAALRESKGKVSGPSGAAVKLGLPGSTLDSKIRSLRIDKNRFKSINP
jgi:PAS domain S-box-containing protein